MLSIWWYNHNHFDFQLWMNQKTATCHYFQLESTFNFQVHLKAQMVSTKWFQFDRILKLFSHFLSFIVFILINDIHQNFQFLKATIVLQFMQICWYEFGSSLISISRSFVFQELLETFHCWIKVKRNNCFVSIRIILEGSGIENGQVVGSLMQNFDIQKNLLYQKILKRNLIKTLYLTFILITVLIYSNVTVQSNMSTFCKVLSSWIISFFSMSFNSICFKCTNQYALNLLILPRTVQTSWTFNSISVVPIIQIIIHKRVTNFMHSQSIMEENISI